VNDHGMLGLLQSTFGVALVISLPLLLLAVVSGVVSGLLQSLANVHDAAAGFAPRLLVTAIGALLLAGWMTAKVVDFAMRCWGSLG
jgi:flagellar biosynthetic protein FliQ